MGIFGRRHERSELEFEYEPPYGDKNGATPESEVVSKDPTPTRSAPSSSKGPSPKSADECSSIISAGSKWQGNLKSDSVRIDGELSGEVRAKDTVHISKGASVDAVVNANYVIIAGNFQGRVHCTERLELMPSSRIKGEMTTKLLTVHEGAFIDGALHMMNPDDIAAEERNRRGMKESPAEKEKSELTPGSPLPESQASESLESLTNKQSSGRR
ncbi:MAG TPA: polymer-forming cytoskeletal protein [Dehalococcoidia bacterium]|nr:polymer-forming cytoskeletal protein [Dehalococcoidia bacterium]